MIGTVSSMRSREKIQWLRETPFRADAILVAGAIVGWAASRHDPTSAGFRNPDWLFVALAAATTIGSGFIFSTALFVGEFMQNHLVKPDTPPTAQHRMRLPHRRFHP